MDWPTILAALPTAGGVGAFVVFVSLVLNYFKDTRSNATEKQEARLELAESDARADKAEERAARLHDQLDQALERARSAEAREAKLALEVAKLSEEVARLRAEVAGLTARLDMSGDQSAEIG